MHFWVCITFCLLTATWWQCHQPRSLLLILAACSSPLIWVPTVLLVWKVMTSGYTFHLLPEMWQKKGSYLSACHLIVCPCLLQHSPYEGMISVIMNDFIRNILESCRYTWQVRHFCVCNFADDVDCYFWIWSAFKLFRCSFEGAENSPGRNVSEGDDLPVWYETVESCRRCRIAVKYCVHNFGKLNLWLFQVTWILFKWPHFMTSNWWPRTNKVIIWPWLNGMSRWHCLNDLLTLAMYWLWFVQKDLVDLRVEVFDSFGKDLLRLHKLHLVAFVQVALQLAYYRLHKK